MYMCKYFENCKTPIISCPAPKPSLASAVSLLKDPSFSWNLRPYPRPFQPYLQLFGTVSTESCATEELTWPELEAERVPTVYHVDDGKKSSI